MGVGFDYCLWMVFFMRVGKLLCYGIDFSLHFIVLLKNCFELCTGVSFERLAGLVFLLNFREFDAFLFELNFEFDELIIFCLSLLFDFIDFSQQVYHFIEDLLFCFGKGNGSMLLHGFKILDFVDECDVIKLIFAGEFFGLHEFFDDRLGI